MLNRGASLDAMFQALADPARRSMMERLSRGPASVSELAQPLAMTFSAAAQHLRVLETSGLVTTEKIGRVRICRIEPRMLAAAEAWLAERVAWERRFERLGELFSRPPRKAEEREMTGRTVAHGTFTVERSYSASPARVFAAWADPHIKGKWYGDPSKESVAEMFEFKVGGREFRQGEVGPGQTFSIDVRYYDIVQSERIVFAYEVIFNGARTSVSVAAVEFRSEGKGMRLVVTEQGAFLDGIENPDERRGGTEFTLDRLGQVLAGQA